MTDLLSLTAEKTATSLYEVGINVERYDYVGDGTVFIGYVGDTTDPEEVMSETPSIVVDAFTQTLQGISRPNEIDQLTAQVYDPSEPVSNRTGAIEWSVAVEQARRYARGDAELQDITKEAVQTSQKVLPDGSVEDLDVTFKRDSDE